MSLRVISGQARGMRLKRVPGDSTRPIMDRVKEALFSILGHEIVDSRFLDLFAGTGSVGIEALSRGAKYVEFLDRERKAIQTIHGNLKTTKLGQNARVLQRDAFSYLKHPPDVPFDIIFVAPPQYKDLWSQTLQALDNQPAWLAPQTQVIVQIDPKEEQEIKLNNLQEFDRRKYGKTLLLFFELIQKEET